MDAKKVLTARFTDAIKKSFNTIPLIGERWFKWHDEVKTPFFQFTGARPLAKATSTTPAEIVRRITRHLDLKGLDAEVSTRANGDFVVKFTTPPEAEDAKKK
jgi:hypothetical protein